MNWTAEQIVTLVVAVFGFAGIIYGAYKGQKNKALQDQHDDAAPSRPTVQQVWDRQNLIEETYGARITAFANIVYQLSEQWPEGAAPPVLDDADIAVIARDMPAKWRRRHRSSGNVTPAT
jgi:hypothetical protein